jgi:uncharacterized membrane protein
LRNLRADNRGVSAIITALSLTALMGFAGLAADVAMWQINKRNMQGAADQAALAAVVAYLAGAEAAPLRPPRAWLRISALPTATTGSSSRPPM